MKESELISAAIKALRSRLGQTQAGMARLLGTSLRTYDRWEAGDTIPRRNTLVRILALCREDANKALFHVAAGSSALDDSRNGSGSSMLSRAGLRMDLRNRCLAAIQTIYESALVGSETADEKLRGYAYELNRQATLLARRLLATKDSGGREPEGSAPGADPIPSRRSSGG